MKIVTALSLAGMFAMATPANAGVSGNYYEEIAAGQCTAARDCIVDFPAFPASIAGKFVTIDEVGCYGAIGSPLIQGTLSLAGGRRQRAISVPQTTPYFSFSHQSKFKVSASNNAMSVYLGATANTTFYVSCSIVGTITAN